MKHCVMLDLVQKKTAGDDPLEIFRDRLERFFKKKTFRLGDLLWIEWAGRWTFCMARESDDLSEQTRGIVYIYRAVYEKTA